MEIKLSKIFGTIWCVLMFCTLKVATLPGLEDLRETILYKEH